MKLVIYVALTLLLSCAAVAHNSPDEVEAVSLIRTHGVKINVDDMEKAISFYCDKLGFVAENLNGYPRYVVLKSDDRNRLILNRVKKLRRPNPSDTRFSFTLQVNDLDQAIERMRSLGVEFAETERRKEGVGNAISIKDPFGRTISLMHQTIAKVEPFKEPRLYNFGFLIPDMEAGRDFYSNRLGFVVRSERYLPLDLPLGHRDKSFAFMLHYRPGVQPIKQDHSHAAPFNTLVFETASLQAAIRDIEKRGVKIISGKRPLRDARGDYVEVADPFGNVSEILEVTK